MQSISGKTERVVKQIYEYQRFLKLNERFIRELEAAGGDTSRLRRETADIQKKILDLKIESGIRV